MLFCFVFGVKQRLIKWGPPPFFRLSIILKCLANHGTIIQEKHLYILVSTWPLYYFFTKYFLFFYRLGFFLHMVWYDDKSNIPFPELCLYIVDLDTLGPDTGRTSSGPLVNFSFTILAFTFDTHQWSSSASPKAQPGHQSSEMPSFS